MIILVEISLKDVFGFIGLEGTGVCILLIIVGMEDDDELLVDWVIIVLSILFVIYDKGVIIELCLGNDVGIEMLFIVEGISL